MSVTSRRVLSAGAPQPTPDLSDDKVGDGGLNPDSRRRLNASGHAQAAAEGASRNIPGIAAYLRSYPERQRAGQRSVQLRRWSPIPVRPRRQPNRRHRNSPCLDTMVERCIGFACRRSGTAKPLARRRRCSNSQVRSSSSGCRWCLSISPDALSWLTALGSHRSGT